MAQTDLTEKPAEDKKKAEDNIPEQAFKTLLERFKQVLGDRVTDVRASDRLSQSVARLVDPQGAPDPEMQRVYKYLGKEVEIPKKILELNPAHSILKNLLKDKVDPALQNLVIEQIFDSALLVEGLHPDPSSMVARVQQIIEAALGHTVVTK